MTSLVGGAAARWHASGFIAEGNGVVIPATQRLETSAMSEVEHHQPILVVDDGAIARIPARDASDGEAPTRRTPGIRLMRRG